MAKENLNLALETFSFKTDDKGDFLVDGFAIHPGKYNGSFRVLEKEMKNCKKTIKNAVFLTDHRNSVANAIGRITHSKIENNPDAGNSEGVYYKAFIDSEEKSVLRKIQKGIVTSTSIGFSFNPVCSICGEDVFGRECGHWFWDEGFEIVCQDMDIHELSVVPAPADRNATVKSMALFEKSHESIILRKKEMLGNKMTKENNEKAFEKKIEKLESDHDQEITKLKDGHDKVFSAKVAEVLTLTTEKEQLETELSQTKEELDVAIVALKKIKDEELAEKRSKLTELNEAVNAKLTAERIAELSEEMLDEFSQIFETQLKSANKVSQAPNVGQVYSANEESDEDPNLTAEERLAQHILSV